jgi:hypothetical protein
MAVVVSFGMLLLANGACSGKRPGTDGTGGHSAPGAADAGMGGANGGSGGQNAGGAGGQNTGGAAGSGGASLGTHYTCSGGPFFTTDGGEVEVNCVVGQSYCYSYQPHSLGPPPTVTPSCETVPSSCAQTPTCACINIGLLGVCSCEDAGGLVNVLCQQI